MDYKFIGDPSNTVENLNILPFATCLPLAHGSQIAAPSAARYRTGMQMGRT